MPWFFKVVRSRAKFWQMVGRGTLTCKDLFEPGKHKKNFMIFDFCDNCTYFSFNPKTAEPSLTEPLSQRIFKRRFLLTRQLAAARFADQPQYADLARQLTDLLHRDVERLDINSFMVRPKRKFVERYSQRAFWEQIGTDDISDIEKELSPLVGPTDKVESARRFDLLIIELQLKWGEWEVAGKSPKKVPSLKRLKNLVTPLLKLGNIPAVKEHMELITAIAICAPDFKESVSIVLLEELREKIRDLIRLISYKERDDVYVDFQDEKGEAIEIKGLVDADPDYDEYRQKVEHYIHDNRDHMTIMKLRTNVPITQVEVEELERILFSYCDSQTREEFRKKMGTDKPLGQFIRSIVGLDMEALKKAFSQFLQGAAFNTQQMSFIDHILKYYHRNGYFDLQLLFEKPFTDIDTAGPFGVFETGDAGNIITIIKRINGNAVGF
ncbi:MAG: hypothetical protein GY757_28685 [bacterium]|nr:hypothetical protein [bacterium]